MSSDFTKTFKENLEAVGVNVVELPAGKQFLDGLAQFFTINVGLVHADTIRPAFKEIANRIKEDANLVAIRSAAIIPSSRPNHVVLSVTLAAYQLSEGLNSETFQDFESGFVVPELEKPKVNEETGKVEPKEPPFAEQAVIPTPEESSAAATTPLENPIPLANIPLTAHREEKMAVNQQKYPEHASEGPNGGAVQSEVSDVNFGPGVIENGGVGAVQGTSVVAAEKKEGEENRQVQSPIDDSTVITRSVDTKMNAQGSLTGPGDESEVSGPGVIPAGNAPQQEVYVDDGDSHDADGSQLAEGETENSGLPEDNTNSDANSDVDGKDQHDEESPEEQQDENWDEENKDSDEENSEENQNNDQENEDEKHHR